MLGEQTIATLQTELDVFVGANRVGRHAVLQHLTLPYASPEQIFGFVFSDLLLANP